MFTSLCSENDDSDIVIIWIGGNDLDEDLRSVDLTNPDDWNAHMHNHALRGVLNLFVRLTNVGKIVYVILLPTRFSTRSVKVKVKRSRVDVH